MIMGSPILVEMTASILHVKANGVTLVGYLLVVL